MKPSALDNRVTSSREVDAWDGGGVESSLKPTCPRTPLTKHYLIRLPISQEVIHLMDVLLNLSKL